MVPPQPTSVPPPGGPAAQRVLLLSRGGQINGSQQQLLGLIDRLDRERYAPVVVSRGYGPFIESLRRGNVPTHVLALHPWRKLAAIFRRYLDAARLVRLARSLGVSLLHSSDLWLNGYLLYARRRLGVPGVLHVRAPKPPAELRKHGCLRADGLIAVSQRVRRHLLEAGVPDERISVVYDAVDLDRFRPRGDGPNVLRRDYPEARGTLVGIVGRIRQSKRQLEFIAAAERLVRGGLDATFFLVGDCHREDYLARIRQRVADARLDGRVVLTGRRADIPDVLASLDMLVTLAGGSVMIEAMACGVPVISAGFTPPAESVIVQDGRTGLVLGPGQESGLDVAIARLAGDADLRARMGRLARQAAEADYGADRLARQTEAAYARALAGR